MDKLTSSLKYFFYTLRVLGLSSIDLNHNPLRISKFWMVYSILVVISYIYYHIGAVREFIPLEMNVNFVTMLIDYYNNYSSLSLFVVCLVTTQFSQRKLIEFLQILQTFDGLFEKLPHHTGIKYDQHAR